MSILSFDIVLSATTSIHKARDLRDVVRGTFNSLGFSSPEPAATTDIVIVGDSFVEASMLDPGQRLAPLINSRLAGSKAISLGRAGADIPDYLITGSWAARRFKPKFMIFVITEGDLFNSVVRKPRGYWFQQSPDRALVLRSDLRFEFRNWLLASRLATYALYNLKFGPSMLFSKSRDAKTSEVHAASAGSDVMMAQAVDEILDRIAAIQSSGTNVLFAFDAERGAIYAGRGEVHTNDFGLLASRAAAQGVTICDLSSAFVADYTLSHQPFDLANGDGHWNAHGSSVVAEAILNVIEKM